MKRFIVTSLMLALSGTSHASPSQEDIIKMFEHGRQIVQHCGATVHSVSEASRCEDGAVYGYPRSTTVPIAVELGADYQMLLMAQAAGFDGLIQGAKVDWDVTYYKFQTRAAFCAFFRVDCAPLDLDWKRHGRIYENANRKKERPS